MKRKKKPDRDPDRPRPLNFDRDKEHGMGDHLDKPYMSSKDARGDDEGEQYYSEEESLSPEEAKLRKKEGTM